MSCASSITSLAWTQNQNDVNIFMNAFNNSPCHSSPNDTSSRHTSPNWCQDTHTAGRNISWYNVSRFSKEEDMESRCTWCPLWRFQSMPGLEPNPCWCSDHWLLQWPPGTLWYSSTIEHWCSVSIATLKISSGFHVLTCISSMSSTWNKDDICLTRNSFTSVSETLTLHYIATLQVEHSHRYSPPFSSTTSRTISYVSWYLHTSVMRIAALYVQMLLLLVWKSSWKIVC